MRRVLLVVLSAAALAPIGATAPAIARLAPAQFQTRGVNSTSTNWSGYAAFNTGTTFTDVKGTWVQPTATCSTRKRTYSSFWVGIDGYNSNSVEQLGTEADCVAKNNPSYYGWYEMYPAAPVNLSMAVHPGDTFSAEVSVSGTTFTLSITNVTTGAHFSINKTSSSAQKTSAEWVAEAPSSFSGVLPLTNFGTVNFSGSFTTGAGHTGSISDGAWSHDAITMAKGATTKAVPSALSPDGTAFSVTWFHT